MTADLVDAVARGRFETEWQQNFAVSANAGSGKTTAISKRLAAMAMDSDERAVLGQMAVVTYTNKAAAEIEQRAREVLLKKLAAMPHPDWAALEALDGVFFGTIHSFCLQLAQVHGQTVGVNLNPTLVAGDDPEVWERFLTDEPVEFSAISSESVDRFLRHSRLETVFELARQLSAHQANRLRQIEVSESLSNPAATALTELLDLPSKGAGAVNILKSQAKARAWQKSWDNGAAFLPLFTPEGTAAMVVAAAEAWMKPLQKWLGQVGGILAGELAERFRIWRLTQGLQTYADQVDAAMAVLADDRRLNDIRSENWRVILDEAQDTDPAQFSILVEITRPVGAAPGAWPGSAEQVVVDSPRDGHFCLVGDGQQAIYGSRADMGNFQRHLAAFNRGDGGELLEFQVTFRAPHAVIAGLNATLPEAFGKGPAYNSGVVEAEGAPAPMLQVPYVPLEAGPVNVDGDMSRLPLVIPEGKRLSVEDWMRAEARQVGQWLKQKDLAGVGATNWSDVALLAPRNDWLEIARQELEAQGWEVALQTRRSRAGDSPAFAWLSGLLAICVDPEDIFEWVGVLREIAGVQDSLIATELQRLERIVWEEPEDHAPEIADWLGRLRPLLLRVDDEGWPLSRFAFELVEVTGLRARARAIDSTGAAELDLDRLLADATSLGIEGAGPREWESHLRREANEGRAAGKPNAKALNLLTCHSAKGLEWPVVIPLGLWRRIGAAPARGLQVIEAGTQPQVYLDQRSIPVETSEARERERWREYTRLLYVTLTRARRRLILPWVDAFGARKGKDPTFAELWGTDLDQLPEAAAWIGPEEARVEAEAFDGSEAPIETEASIGPEGAPAPALPERLLPHRLGHAEDRVRTSRHESTEDDLLLPGGEEAIAYGLWWHEAVEFVPWDGGAQAIEAHWQASLDVAAGHGFAERGKVEAERFLVSDCWKEMADPRWARRAEMAVLAPLGLRGWVDGVVDLVLFDQKADELWIVDWKTNRIRTGERESEYLKRLAEEYRPQLTAYGQCLESFFPGAKQRLLVYSTALGKWTEIEPTREES